MYITYILVLISLEAKPPSLFSIAFRDKDLCFEVANHLTNKGLGDQCFERYNYLTYSIPPQRPEQIESLQ
ncbi:MAG: hypothetical protein Tp139DCM904402_29 [Prokaryotic dsDNA virus sp.]|nr:MAG: hypothetical protein Tp139DCM904402_29 [Prokaryotic dsDNA virus sp.]